MAQYAIVQVGAHQYLVEENTVFDVERLESLQGGEAKLKEVLLVRKNGDVQVGQPFVPNASVLCEVIREFRKPKVISFKFKRRKGYKRLKGHRQTAVRLRVKSIEME